MTPVVIDQQPPGKVVHCKRDHYDVYIGRPGKWSNPFVIGEDGNRRQVIERYEQWLRDEVGGNPAFAAEVAELSGKTLGCFCAPKDCHGDVLLRVAAEVADG